MERTKNTDLLIRWKKIGGGHFTFNGRLIKPGQVFRAREDQIPKSFRDVCVPIDELPETPEPIPLKITDIVYTVVPRGKSKTWFDVVNGKGKVVNEKALQKEQAERLVNDLSKTK